MAYVAGFFAADGNIVQTKRGTHFFSIQVTDKEIIYAIRRVLEAEHTISRRKRLGNEQDLYRLQVGSKEMCEDLRRLGYTERKSKRLQLPDVPRKYFSDFVRGYFDGDGNVWVGYMNKGRKVRSLSILVGFTSGSKFFLESLQSKLASVLGATGSLCLRKNKECWCLRYSVNDSLKLYDFMYNVSVGDLFLQRKKVVFEKYIRSRSSTG